MADAGQDILGRTQDLCTCRCTRMVCLVPCSGVDISRWGRGRACGQGTTKLKCTVTGAGVRVGMGMLVDGVGQPGALWISPILESILGLSIPPV